VGIQIKTAYYADKQAEKEWELAREQSTAAPGGIVKLGLYNTDKLIASRVQQALNNKCSKSYSRVDAIDA